jgi:hypothetical protein
MSGVEFAPLDDERHDPNSRSNGKKGARVLPMRT